MSPTPNAGDDDDRTVIRPTSPRPAEEHAKTELIAPPLPAAAPPRQDGGHALPPGTVLGEFELTQVLGEGGFGIVYLAWDRTLERRVALKEYMPSALASRSGGTQVEVKSERHRDTFEAGRKSFVNEAKLLAQFDHPSLVKVYRFWEANGTAYMVMPFYEGVTLKDHLKALPEPPGEDWLMALLGPLTEALGVLHRENCFHRDIAPDNIILLAGSGRPLLLDFGAARRVIGDMTQALTVILKPGYAPVEQYAEAPNMKQGPWTDVYALAASVYYAITGRTPPPSVGRLMGDSYEPLARSAAGRYGDAFLQAIDRALLVKPEERTASVDELRADLGLAARAAAAPAATVIAGTPPAPAPRPRAERSAPTTQAPAAPAAPSAAPAGSRRGLVVGLGAAVLAAGAGGWWLLGRKPAAPAQAAAPAPVPAAAPAPAPAPEAPPVATAPAPAADGRFDVAAEYEAVLSRQMPGQSLEVLKSPGPLRINRDGLSFSVRSSIDGELTLLAFGPDGSLIRLLPAITDKGKGEWRDSPVRVRAGQAFTFPSPQLAIKEIPIGDPPGLERMLVIVSRAGSRWDGLGAKPLAGTYLELPTGDEARRLKAERGQAARPWLLGRADGGCSGNCDEYVATQFSFEAVK